MDEENLVTPSINALAGSMSSALALAIIYPMDTVKVRIQVQTAHEEKKYSGILSGIQRIVSEEGFAALYNGLVSNLVNQSLSNYLYFYFYAYLKNMYFKFTLAPPGAPIPTPIELSVGVLSGVFGQCVTLPISVISTRQQMSTEKAEAGVFKIVKDIVKSDGITGMWKGFGPSMILCINPAITYGLFEKIKEFIIHKKFRIGIDAGLESPFLTPIEAFLTGALSKVVATIVTYPYISAKARLMWKPSQEEIEKYGDDVIYTGTLDILKKLFKIHGLKGWFMFLCSKSSSPR
ncbi:hypothetical protein BB560_003222 [Smittium megazygosporum]|uniref:Uncharacterized protein n=1 Tax=Smittium megazygosporum TaxID=133381 RepID=A0A2T9ZCK5_9FUNG|nr:hypothetical protein BB560_003222 [Smittium megazygosporum]